MASLELDGKVPLIDEALVRRLVSAQFPEWAQLAIRPVALGGWDNRSFRLGDDMIVRLPSAAVYAAQVEKEAFWLPRLAPLLPVPIPTSLAVGEPRAGYPWRWSVYQWIEGEVATLELIADSSAIAASVAGFLIALQSIDAAGGPRPGPHNFYRGGLLATYDAEARNAIQALKSRIDANAATETWEAATRTAWNHAPVWIHGDISLGNLLVQDGRLTGIIDFGMLGAGDPACDLSIAWTVFRGQSRKTFQAELRHDPATWLRGQAWALWKALIVAAEVTKTNALEWTDPLRVLDQVLRDTQYCLTVQRSTQR